MRTGIAVAFVVALLAASAAADPATAKKHNNAGMKAYGKRDFEGAKKLFEKAIAEDPAFVKAHYNRASMSALLIDLDAMAEEFTWLRGATDPEAARVLAKAKTDADFRGVATIDAARKVIGLPLLADTPLDQLALGYGGWWNGVDEGMMQGWVEVRFLPKGKAKGRDHSGETGQWYSWNATWKVDGRKVVVTKGKQKEIFELQDCAGDTGVEGMVCLSREEGAVTLSPGPFRED